MLNTWHCIIRLTRKSEYTLKLYRTLLFRHSLVCHSNWPRCVLPSHGTPTVLAWFCFPQLPVYFICAWAIPILPNTLLQCLEGCCDDALPCHHFGAKNRLICICWFCIVWWFLIIYWSIHQLSSHHPKRCFLQWFGRDVSRFLQWFGHDVSPHFFGGTVNHLGFSIIHSVFDLEEFHFYVFSILSAQHLSILDMQLSADVVLV